MVAVVPCVVVVVTVVPAAAADVVVAVAAASAAATVALSFCGFSCRLLSCAFSCLSFVGFVMSSLAPTVKSRATSAGGHSPRVRCRGALMGLLRGAHLREQQRHRHVVQATAHGGACGRGGAAAMQPTPRGGVHGRGVVGGSSRGSFWSRLGSGQTTLSTGAAQRLARQALRAVHVGREVHESLLGAASETDAQHRRRHPQLKRDCARCVYLELRPQLLDYGSYHRERLGRRDKTTWLAQRPGHLGGVWALGCVFCSHYMQRRRHAQPHAQPHRRGPQHGNTKWARFEIRAISQMASRGIRQHSETEMHRVATRSYFNPDHFYI